MVLHRHGQGMWVMNVKIYKGYLWQQNKKKGSSDVILLKNFLPLPFIVLLFQRQFLLNLDFFTSAAFHERESTCGLRLWEPVSLNKKKEKKKKNEVRAIP